MQRIEALINDIQFVIDDAGTVPFSKKVLVDSDEIEQILSEIKDSLPEEIKEAKWINEEKDKILSAADQEKNTIIDNSRKEADEIVKNAQARAEELVSDNTITKQATKYGEDLVKKAEDNARILKEQSINYVDEMLAITQDRLQEILQELESNRNELRED